MKQCWDEQDLIEHWSLTEAEKELFTQRTARGRIGLAGLLKFFQLEARFPLHHKEIPAVALEFLAEISRKRHFTATQQSRGRKTKECY